MVVVAIKSANGTILLSERSECAGNRLSSLDTKRGILVQLHLKYKGLGPLGN